MSPFLVDLLRSLLGVFVYRQHLSRNQLPAITTTTTSLHGVESFRAQRIRGQRFVFSVLSLFDTWLKRFASDRSVLSS
jgi:hypothetical protein